MKVLSAAIGAACALAFTATAASAEIVCNHEGDCWHVKVRHDYRPDFGLTVHPDNWRWGEHEHDKFRWREHEGRGYWRNGVWVQF
jgi:hypothetical protein